MGVLHGVFGLEDKHGANLFTAVGVKERENDYKCIKQKHKKCAGSFLSKAKRAEKAGRIRG